MSDDSIKIKDAWEIEIMREAGRIVAQCLKLATEMVAPGVTTGQIDKAVENYIRSRGAVPTFLGYRGYPASICASINHEVVHGIPSPTRELKEGDIISIDIGATYRKYVGDAAVTVPVGKVSESAMRLIEATQGALEAGIRAIRPYGVLMDISKAIQDYAAARGYSVVKKYVGHGVGQEMHEAPQVPNYVDSRFQDYRVVLRPGLVLAIEPMLNEGTDEVETLKDGWTVVTKDGRLSAHFEHTVAVTKNGPVILTLP